MGPISYIGPKTSRAARYRPELNLEGISRHDIDGASPGGNDKRGAPMRHRAPSHGAQPRPACNNLRTGLPASVLAITRSGDHRTATVRLPLATPVRETSTPHRPLIAQPLREKAPITRL
ncbi:hypothetical protein F511_23751 [Dorcoceras hygrometricum]|uniref:Uncharacterized protein n=1 Tax=Dorcoceras hygrometricum TaxID=472368 RepID=A0A2Z7CXV2_9LAMI|nr:hypothetical protein F511_23751 [Dorcoceras hygrometricum]